MSNESTVAVNKVRELYTIVFDLQTFLTFQPDKLMQAISKVFIQNLPDEKEYNFDVEYIDDLPDEYTAVFNEFNRIAATYSKIGEAAVKPAETARRLSQNALVRRGKSEPADYSFFEDFSDYDEDDDEEDDYDEFDPNNFFEDYAYGPRLKKQHKGKYESSVVWNKSKNIKRSINRHGVVISSKDNMRRDKKLIKKFLKDFIPGDANWKKEFRDELAKRWLSVYAVSKKNLKELEKQYRKKRNRSTANKTKAAINFAQKLFNEDTWNNPNK